MGRPSTGERGLPNPAAALLGKLDRLSSPARSARLQSDRPYLGPMDKPWAHREQVPRPPSPADADWKAYLARCAQGSSSPWRKPHPRPRFAPSRRCARLQKQPRELFRLLWRPAADDDVGPCRVTPEQGAARLVAPRAVRLDIGLGGASESPRRVVVRHDSSAEAAELDRGASPPRADRPACGPTVPRCWPLRSAMSAFLRFEEEEMELLDRGENRFCAVQ